MLSMKRADTNALAINSEPCHLCRQRHSSVAVAVAVCRSMNMWKFGKWKADDHAPVKYRLAFFERRMGCIFHDVFTKNTLAHKRTHKCVILFLAI